MPIFLVILIVIVNYPTLLWGPQCIGPHKKIYLNTFNNYVVLSFKHPTTLCAAKCLKHYNVGRISILLCLPLYMPLLLLLLGNFLRVVIMSRGRGRGPCLSDVAELL